MNIEERLIQINKFTRPGTKRSFTRNTVWHYTANRGASANNHFVYFGKTLPEQGKALEAEAAKLTGAAKESKLKEIIWASANVFIDRHKVLIIIPLDEIAYHATSANPYSVGVELCIEEDGTFHPDTVKQAIEFGAKLMNDYGLKKEDNIRHYDVTGKICPKPWVDNPQAWERFKSNVDQAAKGKPLGGARKLELKEDWQYTMLGKALTELSLVGGGKEGNAQLCTYEWAEKAFKNELTVDEAIFVLAIALARSQRRDVEVT